MTLPTDVLHNVAYCLDHFAETAHQNDETAKALRVNRSTVKRWRAMTSEPHESHLRDLSYLLGFPATWFHLPHDQFVLKIDRLDSSRTVFSDFSSVERRIVLSCLLKWRANWKECFERHRGTYLMYSRLLTDPSKAAVSHLRIIDLTANGISFSISNFDTRVPPGAEPVEYRYGGLMFPVAECLSFYAEEQSGTEPFSMITSAAQVRGKSILAGFFCAVAVAGALRMPSGTKAALVFRSSKQLDPSTEIDRLGVKSWEIVPEHIKQLL
jgi:hypothetical protein